MAAREQKLSLAGLAEEGDPGSDDREPDVDDELAGDAEPSFGWKEEEAALGRYPSLMGKS